MKSKAICITIPIELIEVMNKQHIDKSGLITELLLKHFSIYRKEKPDCMKCRNIDSCDRDKDSRVLSCSSYEER